LRDFSKIRIDDNVISNEITDKRVNLIDRNISDISQAVMREDKHILDRMSSSDVARYVAVETYFTLIDYIEWLDEKGVEDHKLGEHCPVCFNKQKALYLVDCLIRRWLLTGKKKEYEEAVRFRADAMDVGRKLN
jgi:hypothetical protein